MGKHYPFRKVYGIGTKWRYSSGMLHAAYDYLTPRALAVLDAEPGGIIPTDEEGAPPQLIRNRASSRL